MPRYESYKDSGVDWLGDIPSNWGILPGVKFIRERSDSNKGMIEDRVLSLSYGKIIIKPKEKLVGLVPESFETYQLVDPDDIIVRCTDLQNDQTSLRVGLAKNRGIITSAYLNLQPRAGQSPRFLHYYLHALDITKVLYKFGSGLRQNLSFTDFKYLPIPSLPYEYQEAIANFLDQKTAQIDQAIAIKERQIALLKERKQIIIQNAVTKGLNPDAPMKASGVDWLGDIPAHWEVTKLTYHLKYSIGFTPDSGNSLYYGEGYDWANISDLNANYLRKTKNQITQAAIKRFKPTIAPEGSLLFSFKLSVGLVSIAAKDLYTNEAIAAFQSSFSVITRYLFYMAPISLVHNAGENIYGAKILNQDKINSAKIIVPPTGEQEAIYHFLDKSNLQIDHAIDLHQAQTHKLQEYKATLINSAVTGKIKIS